MKEEYTKKEKIFSFLVTIALTVLSAVSVFLPYAQYRYKSQTYTLSGLEMLTGKAIMGGSLTVKPVYYMVLVILTAIVILATELLWLTKKFRSIKAAKGILCGCSLIQLTVGIVFIIRIKNYLNGAKQVSITYGVEILMILAAMQLFNGLVALYKKRYLCALDFFIVPALIYLLINNYLPMIGISFAFKKIDFSVGVWDSAWCGLSNFKYLFATKDAFIITRNTLCYNLVFIILSNIFGILMGICLCEITSKWLKKISQSCILLPQLISAVIIAYIVFGFLSAESGFINNTIVKDGYIDFYNTRIYWPFIIVFVYLWKQIGYSSIIYLSSIVGIDRNTYEASYIDGCSKWAQIRYITLPLLKPTIITMVLLQVGRIFYSDFGLFYQVPMDSGSLYRVTNTIDTYVYRSLMKSNNISMSAAASAYQAICGFAIVLIANGIVRKLDKENAMF